MRHYGLEAQLATCLVLGLCRSTHTEQSPGFCESTQDVCSCYQFAEGLFVECHGTPPLLHGAINSLTIHGLESSKLTTSILPQYAGLRQLNIFNSGLEDIHTNAFDHVKDYLESLIIVSGKLKHLPFNAFKGLVALRSLDLEANEILEIASKSFNGLNLFKLNLKGNMLERVSKHAFAGLEKTLTELDLSENKLKTFPMNSLQILDNLISLRLGWNEIKSIENDSVSNIPSLRILDLSSNNFQFIASNCFRAMPSITTLTMFSNDIDAVHVDAFSSLLALEYLDLSHNKIISLDKKLFKFNNNLEVVDITHNRIYAINGIFEQLPYFKELFSSENNLLEISSDDFAHDDSVRVLRLQENTIRRIHSNAFITLRNLNELYLSRNHLKELSVKLFSFNTCLTILHLDHNNIEDLSPGVFENLTGLKNLRLDNNRLEIIKNGIFDSLTSLSELHLQNNALQVVELESFHLLYSLQHINLQGNFISKLSGTFTHTSPQPSVQGLAFDKDMSNNTMEEPFSMQIIWLGNNLLTRLDRSLFSDLMLIQRLYLNNNSINLIEDHALGTMHALVLLDLSQNHLIAITKYSFGDLFHLEELFLSNNKIQSIVPLAFNSLKKLRTLDLSGNKLTTLSQLLFQQRLPIRVLNLKNSRISHIDSGTFEGLNNLIDLNLEDNSLTEEELHKLNIPGLRILRVSGNLLPELSDIAFDQLQSVQNLALDNSSIYHISENFLTKNEALLSLSISFNHLSFLNESSFQRQKILNELNLAGNIFKQVPYNAIKNLKSITKLDLGHNLISSVDLSLFKDLSNIQELDLRNNQIISIFGFTASILTQLHKIFLNGNKLSILPIFFFKSFPQLQTIDVSFNKLFQLPIMTGDCQLNLLNASGNPLNKVHNPNSSQQSFLLKQLFITHTNLTVISSQDLETFSGLVHLFLYRNRIARISPGAFASLLVLLTLDLSYNELENLPSERLQGMKQLRLLNVSQNRLNAVATFPNDLRQLQILDLSGNQITYIGREIFYTTPHLTELLLAGNWISSINGESFKPLKKLIRLDISRNYLENFPLHAILPLESQIQSFRVEENPLNCDCEQQAVWAWLQDNQRLGAAHVRCDQPAHIRGQMLSQLSAAALCGSALLIKLAIQDIQPFSFVISWQSRNYSGLQGYQVSYLNQDQSDRVQVETKLLDRSTRSVRVGGLDPGARYQVCVAGLGSWSDDTANQTQFDSPTSKCTHVRTLYHSNSALGQGASNSILTRRLGLIVGSCMGSAVFLILVTVLGYLKIKKQQQVTKTDPPLPPEFISYSIYPTS